MLFSLNLQFTFGQKELVPKASSDEHLDSLFVEIQIRMNSDSTLADLKMVSDGLSHLINEYNDEYSLTKNLYFLDYKLMRNQDYVSRSILRFWLGVFMHNQHLNLNALEIWKDVEINLPTFLIPDFYLLKGIAQSNVFDYANARISLANSDNRYAQRDTIRWRAREQMAYTFRAEKNYIREIDIWLGTLSWLGDSNNITWLIDANHSIAQAYVANGDLNEAIPYLTRTYDYHFTLDPDDPEIYQYYVEIAIIFQKKGQHQKAIGYLKKALKPMRKSKNKEAEAGINNVLAEIYFELEKYDEALKYSKQSIAIAKKYNFENTHAESYLMASKIDEALGNDSSALKNYKDYLALLKIIDEKQKQQFELLWKRQYEVERAEKEFALLIANEEFKDFELQQLLLEKEKDMAEMNLLKQKEESKDIELLNQILIANEANQHLEITKGKLKSQQQESEIENLKKDQQISELIIKNQLIQEKEDKVAIEVLKKDNELALMDAEQQRRAKNRVRWIGGLLIIMAILAISFFIRERKNRKVIAIEKNKSDNLLLNILPKETADELKANGVALPKIYESVSVLFTDFSGFARLSEKMNPQEVLRKLEVMFSSFDEIAEKNKLERIKTIGDGYMCASGLPIPDENNAINAVKTGLAFLEATAIFNKEQVENGREPWKLRVGINTGSVVAGVIGKKKFAYDIWGDTVNLASRAESHGLENQLNITENTYHKIKDFFECEHRGKIDVKNLGSVNMYIVKGYKS